MVDRIRPIVTGLLAAICLIATARPSPSNGMPVIAITAAPDRWRVAYTLVHPALQLRFVRTPDASRTRTWTLPPGFEIVRDKEGEAIRRRNGQPFAEVTVYMQPTYRDLPMDYAPFSPFGDGGMLFHTGRLFACAGTCADNPHWRMHLTAPATARILVNGTVHGSTTQWTDDGDGRSVYVGAGRLTRSGDLVAMIDGALPDTIRQRLDADLPRFMRFYAARLGALRRPPMLFVSYDAAHRGGWGRQGGTLPGQVFVHFYGPGWPERMAAPDFDFDLAWHLAHESAHIYQRGMIEPGDGAAWVHEGGAEASAALALTALDPVFAAHIATKRADASAACAKATSDRSLEQAIAGGNGEAAYSCGLVLNLALDHAVRAADPRSDGLFTVWRVFSAHRRSKTPSSYVDVVVSVAGRCVADALRTSVTLPGAASGERLAACHQVSAYNGGFTMAPVPSI